MDPEVHGDVETVVEAAPETNEHDVAIAEAQAEAAVEIAQAEAAADVAEAEVEAAAVVAAVEAAHIEDDERWQELSERTIQLETRLSEISMKLEALTPPPLTPAETAEVETATLEHLSDVSPTVSPESDAPTAPEPVPEPKRRHRWI